MLDDYRRECAVLIDKKRFDAMAVDSKTLVIYDLNRFKRDTAIDAWKRQSAVLSRWYVGILVDTCFADMSSVRSEQELSYCR